MAHRHEDWIDTVRRSHVTEDGIRRTAVYSPCEKYRYSLEIVWGRGPTAVVIGLNPSTATELEDDPTLRRCQNFARGWKCGGISMLNAFAWRSTDRMVLARIPDPVGPGNTIEFIRGVCEAGGGPRVAAWGNDGHLLGRAQALTAAIEGLQCLHVTKTGHPGHPLYLPGSSRLQSFSYEMAA